MSTFDTIESAVSDLKQGKVIIVVDDEDRENEGDLIALGELISPEIVNFMAKEARGLICSPISSALAKKFELNLSAKRNEIGNDTNFTDSVDHISVSTGISAEERAITISKLASAEAKASEFKRPGHIFPLIAVDGGVLVRAGHTEAAIDLANLCEKAEVGAICEIMNDDGSMARLNDLIEFKKKFGLKLITIKDLIEYRFKAHKLVMREVEVPISTDFGEFTVFAYSNKVDDFEHIAVVKNFDKIKDVDSVLVRVHSECFTGDVLHSKRCDCGEQLEIALRKIEAEECGVVLYMRQEGRGIGLINKLKSYKLQDSGMDTVEANKALGFKDDLRHYGIGAQILVDLGLKNIRLMTNNPTKIVGIEGYGLEVVDRVAIETPPNDSNAHYLLTKKNKMGHILSKFQ